MKAIVSKQWLLARLYEQDLVIADCRFVLGQPDAGRTAYEQGHIPGARYFDLERELSAPVTAHGGRHPLPDMDELAGLLGRHGIDRQTRIVAYDDQGGAMASRLWWLLRYLGHEQVYVMDGGFSQWRQEGYPVTAAPPAIAVPKQYIPELQPDMLLSAEEVRSRLGASGTVLLDSREERRYLGLEEPIDKAAGHIPGAVNLFWKGVLDENGRWKRLEGQQQRLAGLDKDKEIVVYCGSGVTACPNVLALQEAGFPHVKLYAGSWSDWISYPDNPVATGEK
ncbi:sulfurtransferase [Paenibacillus sp. y28]|uniref:sulfurtransferase n=1 Tax=Paenibacillus sp. y28 TaxID=3129110 RepID=UPI003018577D